MGDNRELAAAVEAAFRSGEFGQVASLLPGHATDDFVEEWPQSGERLTRPMVEKMGESYEAGSGTTPTFKYRRMLGGGDVFTVEGTIDYGDGIPVSYVGIGEIRDGKVFRMTEYFANPFEPPAWRAGLTERMEPASA